MKNLLAAIAVLALTVPAFAEEVEPKGEPSPNEIVDSADASDWVAIPAEDLLVMTLAPDRDGNARQVVMQLMPAPFSQGWVENIRTLARAGWYDGVSVNRVQDNYVVQWGDPNVDNPEVEGEAKALPEGLKVMSSRDYTIDPVGRQHAFARNSSGSASFGLTKVSIDWDIRSVRSNDAYGAGAGFANGWPVGYGGSKIWPVHCYGMVGVGRGYAPDAGSGAELYTVIGHAPRHLDRNIALVGRVIEGIEHLSSLPRGKGQLGFYDDKSKLVPIQSIRVAGDLPTELQPKFEYLSTREKEFREYAHARANRRDPFFISPAGGADICNIPVPVRRVSE